MFIIHRTLRFQRSYGEPAYTDHYELADTFEEAQLTLAKHKARDYVPGEYDLYAWAISEVLDASEPHWIEKKEVWGPDK
jgi:hypothetical protein